eukprot:374588-Rhodomonas_salina.1
MVVYLQHTDLPPSSALFGRSTPPQRKYSHPGLAHASLRGSAQLLLVARRLELEILGVRIVQLANPGSFEVHCHAVLLCSLEDLPIKIPKDVPVLTRTAPVTHQGHSSGTHPTSHIPLEFGV